MALGAARSAAEGHRPEKYSLMKRMDSRNFLPFPSEGSMIEAIGTGLQWTLLRPQQMHLAVENLTDRL